MRNLANITALAVALALSAGAGMAIGSTRPDDRATHGQGAIVLEQRTDVVRPDDRARHGQGAIVLERRSDAVRPDDRATHGQGAIEFEQVARADQVPVIAEAGSASARGTGFDWLDAGIGAAAALGLGLIVAGSVVVRRRAHEPSYS